ncbi:unnamed protein product [Clonostachys rhizophaga]|uniref:Cdc24/Scd1 N-terminal domain-containing protein n=1 Tax=Clonostachys rhizophaga TaxID=160324 RepID=A0A9N9YNA2_9HYPO|nr:unnamed protein product [Clonostachys rhizophaga]
MLLQLPEFQEEFEEADILYQNEPKNPLRDLKHVCQKGTPLLVLYNKLQPGRMFRRYPDPTSHTDLSQFIDNFNAFGLGRTNAFTILSPSPKAFTILDPTGDSYVGFFKVVETLESILGELVKRKILKQERLSAQLPSYPDAFEDVRATVASFLDTERDFFERLRKLLSIKTKMGHELFNRKESKIVFGPIDRIVDWQVELLLAIETQVLKHPFSQRWNIPFTPLARISKDFQVYDSSSSKRGAILRAKMERRNKILSDLHVFALQQLTALSGLLILHLDQYEKFIESLVTLFQKRDPRLTGLVLSDLMLAVDAIKSIQMDIKQAKERVLMKPFLVDLNNRIQDWEGHQVEHFGELVMCGRYLINFMGKTKPVGRMPQRQENNFKLELTSWTILLICKEQPLAATSPQGLRSSIFPEESKASQAKLNLGIEAIILLQNVTELVPLKINPKDFYHLGVRWQIEHSAGSLNIYFSEEKQMREWGDQIHALIIQARASSYPVRVASGFRSP